MDFLETYSDEEYCLLCETEEEAIDFTGFLHDMGRSWCSGDSYLDSMWSKRDGRGQVYYFNEGTKSTLGYAEDNGYIILKFKDFEECIGCPEMDESDMPVDYLII